ncbi:hypothetical protein L6452_18480 [Arctium lappa]|uniref:Uncharacterized protein n=1 Tax=Arctium lappa TaxID=4217 RepID=A0ACB9C6F3_ARCLA|nr:hypothetical protein L6452_18480 [Arctium lappa]
MQVGGYMQLSYDRADISLPFNKAILHWANNTRDSLLIDPSLLIDYHSLFINSTLSFGDLVGSERAKGHTLLIKGFSINKSLSGASVGVKVLSFVILVLVEHAFSVVLRKFKPIASLWSCAG